jgi:3-oxoacyl-[acyl-carrier protein] reductase
MEAITEAMGQMQPLARPGVAIDIARAAAWLCSDEADYITGQAIVVDGGEGLGKMWSKQYLK